MAIETPNVIHAMITYNGIADTINKNSGFSGAVRNNQGDYSLILEQQVRGILSATVSDPGTPVFITAFLSTPTGQVSIFAFDSAGAPVDTIIDVIVFAVPHQAEGL